MVRRQPAPLHVCVLVWLQLLIMQQACCVADGGCNTDSACTPAPLPHCCTVSAGVRPVATLCLLLAYIAAFALGSGPATWVVLAEMLPERVKGPGAALATAAAWTGAVRQGRAEWLTVRTQTPYHIILYV
jgi:Sugar (and other) transporter